MHITVTDAQTNRVVDLKGPSSHIQRELLREFPWIAAETHVSLKDTLKAISRSQNLFVRVVEAEGAPLAKNIGRGLRYDSAVIDSMAGYNSRTEQAMEAARYLSSKVPTEEELREAVITADGNPEVGVLIAHGIEPTKENLELLRVIIEGQLSKSDKSVHLPKADSIDPFLPIDKDASDAVKRAFDKDMVFSVKLGGKHAKGMFVAWDEQTGETYLVKPGYGKQNPAAGLADGEAGQSQREAAFYRLAEEIGLGQHIPETRLVYMDGSLVAILRLLPWHYEKAQDVKKRDEAGVRRLFHLYMEEGVLFRWAVLDYIGGNVDRHGGNVMIYDSDVQMIDHGSSMAGANFNPGGDKFTFVPFYLRVFVDTNFKLLPPETRVKTLPLLSNADEQALRDWFYSIDIEAVTQAVAEYGIDPLPIVARYKKLSKNGAHGRLDLAINEAWCLPVVK